MSSHSYKGKTLDNRAVEVTVKGKTIASVLEIPNTPELPWLLPPLVDLQHNGSLGISYCLLDSADDLRTIGKHLLSHGVCRVLPTFPTYEYEEVCRGGSKFRKFVESDPALAKLFFGIFHEGVFISPDDGWRGAHGKEHVQPPNWELFKQFDDATGGLTRVINIAPEEPGGLKFIDKAIAAGKQIALGHCNPDTAAIREAVKRGATIVTHFGNGAAPLIPRFKNPFWEFLANPGLSLGLVGDGFHLPPEVVQVAIRQKGYDNCFVVSDANRSAGLPPGCYESFNGSKRILEPNGFLHLENSEILSGSSCQLDHCVEFLINEVGFTFESAWRQCSIIPANIIGIKLPELKTGEEATFVQGRFVDRKLNLECTVFNGEVYILQETNKNTEDVVLKKFDQGRK